MFGARSGKANIVRILLKAGADITPTDHEGMTALMHAADSVEAAGAVEELLKAGAAPNIKDRKGRTALKIAEKSNCFGRDECCAAQTGNQRQK